MAMTPEQEASYALDWGLDRDDLKPAIQAIYDRQKAEREARGPAARRSYAPPEPEGRTSPEVREKILRLVKKANPKYAKAFTADRLAMASIIGTESWAEYGQVVLQMAILDTLLSIEELLRGSVEQDSARRGNDRTSASKEDDTNDGIGDTGGKDRSKEG